MVGLETVDAEDAAMIKSFIEKHLSLTKSKVAERILNNFDAEVANFVKVFPTDYKRVLAERKKKVALEAVLV